MENLNALIMNGIVYDCRWSTNLDEKFISDFCKVERAVFHNDYSEAYLKKKFLDNIYGPSVLEVVYIDGEVSAARALWRNDLEGKEAYQPVDTCVMDNCRGKGVFTEMTKRSIALLPKEALIYNFPNHKSYPGYLKMGWKLLHEYGIRLFTSRRFFNEHPIKMDNEYAKWWIIGRSNISYIKRGRLFFLVRPDRRPLLKHVIACVDAEIAKAFPKSSVGILFYLSEKSTFYNRSFLKRHVVCKDSEVAYIPTWKIDAL